MITPRSLIIRYIEQGRIPPEKINDALKSMQIVPDSKRWRTFVNHLLLWLGGLSLAFAIMFFIAYNWNDLGRFAKFVMVEGVTVLAIAAYCWRGVNTSAGKVSLLAAIISVGVLLALYGQTYQTGADPWQLFFNWALLILPWVLIGRFPAIWIVWAILINISIILYYQTSRGVFGIMFNSETGIFWLTFIFNTLALIIWEFLAARRHWLSERWPIRLLALASGISITCVVLFAIFDNQHFGSYPLLVWGLWLALMFFFYRKINPDLFMLASCCLSGISVIVSLLGRHMFEYGDAGAFLLLALVVIGMGSGAAFWLKNVHQESQV